jgi:DNA-binding response OmpR family regulator
LFNWSASHRVLPVDDDDAVREMMRLTLEAKGFEVVPAASVTAALKLIVTEIFDVLITDLHMPNPSDGFAGDHCNAPLPAECPDAAGKRLSRREKRDGAILLEADDIIVKPFEPKRIADTVHEKLLTRKVAAQTPNDRVAAILQRCMSMAKRCRVV